MQQIPAASHALLHKHTLAVVKTMLSQLHTLVDGAVWVAGGPGFRLRACDCDTFQFTQIYFNPFMSYNYLNAAQTCSFCARVWRLYENIDARNKQPVPLCNRLQFK